MTKLLKTKFGGIAINKIMAIEILDDGGATYKQKGSKEEKECYVIVGYIGVGAGGSIPISEVFESLEEARKEYKHILEICEFEEVE